MAMRRSARRILTAAISAGFALLTALAMYVFLPAQDVRDGSWILALAFVAVFIGIAAFTRSNERQVEHFLQHKDWASLRATLWRSRGDDKPRR